MSPPISSTETIAVIDALQQSFVEAGISPKPLIDTLVVKLQALSRDYGGPFPRRSFQQYVKKLERVESLFRGMRPKNGTAHPPHSHNLAMAIYDHIAKQPGCLEDLQRFVQLQRFRPGNLVDDVLLPGRNQQIIPPLIAPFSTMGSSSPNHALPTTTSTTTSLPFCTQETLCLLRALVKSLEEHPEHDISALSKEVQSAMTTGWCARTITITTSIAGHDSVHTQTSTDMPRSCETYMNHIDDVRTLFGKWRSNLLSFPPPPHVTGISSSEGRFVVDYDMATIDPVTTFLCTDGHFQLINARLLLLHNTPRSSVVHVAEPVSVQAAVEETSSPIVTSTATTTNVRLIDSDDDDECLSDSDDQPRKPTRQINNRKRSYTALNKRRILEEYDDEEFYPVGAPQAKRTVTKM